MIRSGQQNINILEEEEEEEEQEQEQEQEDLDCQRCYWLGAIGSPKQVIY
jgi:sulfatase maturation enzyme AslB (radical SAM superfamily)